MGSIVKRLIGYLLIAGTAVGSVVAVNNAQNIIDWWRLRDYQPSATISRLADTTQMNDLGRRLFYVHNPAILDKSSFQTSCTVGEATIVLGCYVSNQRIYIYDVTDVRLDGVEEVTAAHEMLHAAYDRLPSSEKERIGVLLNDAYNKTDNNRLRENIKSYKDRDPSIVTNELHSILGTEVRDLPKDLEEYYSQYFIDRNTVVTLAEAYSAEFVKREKQIEDYDKNLTVLNGDITLRQAGLSLKSEALKQERRLLESQRNNPAAFNQAVDGYNENVVVYNNEVNALKVLIDEYNKLIVLRNSIAIEERELVEAIDTRESVL